MEEGKVTKGHPGVAESSSSRGDEQDDLAGLAASMFGKMGQSAATEFSPEFFQSLPEGLRSRLMQKFTEQMAKLQSDPSERRKLKEEVGLDLENFGVQRTNRQLMKDHERMVQQQKKMLSENNTLKHATNSSNRKPGTEFPKPPALNACTPIHAKALQPGTTHKGRVLRGTIVSSEPVVMTGVVFLVKDEVGDIAMVSIYNFIPSEGMTLIQRIKAASQSLAEGKQVAIIEPYYKIMSDGRPGIRIDHPLELVFLDSLGPTDISGWQEEGKKHFQAKQYVEAVRCYDKALGLLDKDSCLTSALLNLSATALKLDKPECALLYAGAAMATQPSNCKAWYRMALAFDCLNEAAIAKHCMEKSAQLTPPIKPQAKADLMAQLKNTGTQASSSSFTADVLNKRTQKYIAGIALGQLGAVQKTDTVSSGLTQDAHETSAAARATGNEHFKQSRWAEALTSYKAALEPLSAQAGVLLSNRAAARLLLPGQEALLDAVRDAQAACTVDNSYIKAHYRRITALLQLDWLTEASQACEEGLKLAPDDTSMLNLKARIESAQKATSHSHGTRGTDNSLARKLKEGTSSSPANPAASQTGSGPTASTSKRATAHKDKQQGHELSERELSDMNRENAMSVEQLAQQNQMMGMMMTMQPDMKKKLKETRMPAPVDMRVPAFHEEFSKGGRWPPQCDVNASYRHLWNAYEHARCINMHEIGLLQNSKMPLKSRFTTADLIKRLGSVDRETISWVVSARTGDVRFRDKNAYCSTILHSFTNVPCRKEVLTPGKTHVAVGFLDLGGLCESLLAWGPKQMSDAACEGGSLTWVGYDASAYSTAKTLVIATMAQLYAEVDDILQVWYSSCWSRSALLSFRKAITHILQDPNSVSSDSRDDILKLLVKWQLQDVPLGRARKEWLNSLDRLDTYIANFKHKEDRMALCKYTITGSLLKEEVGSVVMFAIPPEFGEKAMDELFLQTIPYIELVESWKAQPNLDIIAVGVEHLRRRIAKLKECLTSGRVAVQVHACAVVAGDTALHAHISQLKPYTMSWSNVPDYVDPAAFHKMARACSAPGCKDTIHYMHSMNWVQEVKGACHLDYMMNDKGDDKSSVAALLDTARDAIEVLYDMQGVKHLLLLPPVDNARNIADLCLYTIYHPFWVKAFFGKAGLKNFEKQVQLVEPPQYNVISRTNTTMHITFTYDPAIHFNPTQGS